MSQQPTTPPLGEGERAQIEELAKQARQLNANVATWAGENGTTLVHLAERNRTTRKWVVWLAVSLVLDLVLTVGGVVVLDQTERNAARIDRLSSNLRVQLCGVLGLLVNADSPKAREAARARGDDMAARAKAIASITRSYDSLDCGAFVK